MTRLLVLKVTGSNPASRPNRKIGASSSVVRTSDLQRSLRVRVPSWVTSPSGGMGKRAKLLISDLIFQTLTLRTYFLPSGSERLPPPGWLLLLLVRSGSCYRHYSCLGHHRPPSGLCIFRLIAQWIEHMPMEHGLRVQVLLSSRLRLMWHEAAVFTFFQQPPERKHFSFSR